MQSFIINNTHCYGWRHRDVDHMNSIQLFYLLQNSSFLMQDSSYEMKKFIIFNSRFIILNGIFLTCCWFIIMAARVGDLKLRNNQPLFSRFQDKTIIFQGQFSGLSEFSIERSTKHWHLYCNFQYILHNIAVDSLWNRPAHRHTSWEFT